MYIDENNYQFNVLYYGGLKYWIYLYEHEDDESKHGVAIYMLKPN